MKRLSFDRVLVGISFMLGIIAVILVITAPDKPTTIERANSTCKGHGGVQSIDAGRYSSDTVVCADNVARSL